MIRPFALSFLLSLLLLQVGCSVESLSGCRSNDDCRFGRVCQAGLCTSQGRGQPVQPDAATDAGGSDVARDTTVRDTGRDTAEPDVQPREARIRLNPDVLDFGTLEPGAVRTLTVMVSNPGSADLVLEEPFFADGRFVATLVGPSTVQPGRSSQIAATATAPPNVPASGLVIEDELLVPSNASNANPARAPAFLQVERRPDESCLMFEDVPRRVELDVGEEFLLTTSLFNCGRTVVFVGEFGVETQGDSAAVELLDFPLIELGPGEVSPLTLLVTGLAPGRTRATVRVFYDEGQLLELPLTINVLGVVCDLSLRATADRDGPSTQDMMTVVLGHQIRFNPAGDRRAQFENIALWTAPADSLQTLAVQGPTQAVLVPDRPGRYVVQADLFSGPDCAAEATITVDVVLPEDEFVAWVVWLEPYPSGPYSDLDFYVARRTEAGYFWQEPGFHVGPTSRTANFGDAAVTEDDPQLNTDYNVEGFGPERITIAAPSAEEQIAIGVHVFNAVEGQDVVRPWIRIALAGEIVFEAELTLAQNQFWLAAETLGTELVATHEIVSGGFPEPGVP
jgi:hypothetical protein